MTRTEAALACVEGKPSCQTNLITGKCAHDEVLAKAFRRAREDSKRLDFMGNNEDADIGWWTNAKELRKKLDKARRMGDGRGR